MARGHPRNTIHFVGSKRGIDRTIVPATKVDNRRGGKKTVAEFDPPMFRAQSAALADRLAAHKLPIDDIEAAIARHKIVRH